MSIARNFGVLEGSQKIKTFNKNAKETIAILAEEKRLLEAMVLVYQTRFK